MFERTLPVSKRTFLWVDVRVYQMEEALGMAAPRKELRIPSLCGPWEGQPGRRGPPRREVGCREAPPSVDVLGVHPSLPVLEG